MATNTTTTNTIGDPWVMITPGDWVTTQNPGPWVNTFPAGTATPLQQVPVWHPPPIPNSPPPGVMLIPVDDYIALKKELEEAKARIERLVESLTLLSQGEPVP